ncbi:hypothetical protein [Paractinoplanes lichenicola]|uniref:Uncharacterized protein n=1 Tax=Paractinoplanes lichenicola TaxID=2802976 RepID=A0ABS1VTF5_9ACTN|nr:hypothetical protein [Actinoplanes lichenicola]MBL7257752.1 hypothetical protein [Actinoplanes lichenicola]
MSPATLFDHALRLHRQHPGGPLPDGGKPYPDDEIRRPRSRNDPRLAGADVAAILDRHFGSVAHPSDLVFRDCDVPIHRNEHIAAAALRADRQRVRRTGRWLVRHATDRRAALVGLALLATDHADDDIPLIQTIGLLADWFGPLAAEALQRRRDGAEALTWLAERTTGWGRVYVIEALCRLGSAGTRSWMLRHACDGDFLNGYFAGQVATTAHLHEAITGDDVDDALIDHTGRLLKAITDCGGMGTTLEHYPPSAIVLAAHATHLSRQAPTFPRYVNAATIADELITKPPARSGCTSEQRDTIVGQYLTVLERPEWNATARTGLTPPTDLTTWFLTGPAARLPLNLKSDEPPAAPPG